MSLSRNQEENNYWPSISDMFLVFFVLTLALLAMGREAGDKFIQDDLISEAKILVDHANRDLGRESIPWPETPKDDLAGVALAMRECRKWIEKQPRGVIKAEVNEAASALALEDDTAEDGVTEVTAREVLGRNVKAMYLMLVSQDASLPDLYYDKMLREINLELTKRNGGLTPEQQVEDLKKKVQGKDGEISQLKAEKETLKQEVDRLNKLIEQLRNGGKEQEKLLARIAELERHTQKQAREIESLTAELKEKSSTVFSLQTKLKDAETKLVAVTKDSKISQIVLQEGDVTFAHNGTKPIVNPNGRYRELIQLLTKTLEDSYASTYVVEVIGHTDSSGESKNAGINSFFGMQRANSFIEMLKKDLQGTSVAWQLDRLRMLPYSASFHQPIKKPNGTIDEDASRRIEVIIRPEKTTTP